MRLGVFMLKAAKLVVTLGLISVLLWMVDWPEAGQLVERLRWSTLAVALAAMMLELLISVWKWSQALRLHALVFPFGHLFRAVCAGYFMNNFLPTSIGGDAYRVYRTLPAEGYRSRAVSAVLVDRLTGLAVLLTFGAMGAVLAGGGSTVARGYLLLFMSGATVSAALLAAIRFGFLRPLVARFRHLAMVDALDHNLRRLVRERGALLRQVGLSATFQAISIGIVYWLFLRTGSAVPLAECALIVAAAGVAALLPLSINGIGLMEGSFVLVAVNLGVDYEAALLVSLVRRMMIMLLGLLCGLVYLTEGPSVAKPPATAG